jgi:hypothetical protein
VVQQPETFECMNGPGWNRTGQAASYELKARAKLDRFVGILAEKRAKAVIFRMRIARKLSAR